MITSLLYGGLGNQMFIYAITRSLSLKNNVSYAFNTGFGFERDYQYHRSLELDKFDLEIPKVRIQTFDYKGGYILEKASLLLGRNILAPKYKCIREDESNYHLHKELLNHKNQNVYLHGYWQDARYFADVADVIKKDFTFSKSLPIETMEELSYLRHLNRPLVMVGIRRYQEVSNPACPIQVCNEKYYYNAMKIILQNIESPLFVVFCQDSDWAKAHISSEFECYFVKQKTGNMSTMSDLALMRACHHAVISNSTFYWWGAWLQTENQKDHIVVSPSNFVNPSTPCKEWIVINA